MHRARTIDVHSTSRSNERSRSGAMGSQPREAPPTAVPRFDDVASDQSLRPSIDAIPSPVPRDDDILCVRERRRRDADASDSPEAEVEDDSYADSRADVAGDEASEADAPGTRRSTRSRKAPDAYGDFVRSAGRV